MTLLCCLVHQSSQGTAQTASPDPVFEASGFQKNRAYFSQLPFESIDMVSGNLMLTFTDLVLPGNAGMDARFQRTYNHNGRPKWSFGMAGIPLTVRFPDGPSNCGPTPRFPRIVTADGAEHEAFPRTPYPELDPSPCYPLDTIFVTSDFWRWDRTTHLLQLPNGWTIQYSTTFTIEGNSTAYAEEVRDAFNNVITVEWQGDQPKSLWRVRQGFGANERLIEFTNDEAVVGLPRRMLYNGREWSYEGGAAGLTAVRPPTGPPWTFDYSDGLKVTAPPGGETHYRFKVHQFQRLQPPAPTGEDRDPKIKQVNTIVVDTRSAFDGTAAGTWRYLYGRNAEGETITVEYPDQRRMVHVSGGIGQLSWEYSAVASYGIIRRTLTTAGGSSPETEVTTYVDLPVGDDGYAKIGDHAAPATRTITRGESNYVTQYSYSTTSFADYHRPYQIVETGDGSRTRSIVYDYAFSRWIKDRTKSQTVSSTGGGSFTTSAEFDDGTGFKLSETRHGISTLYWPAAQGNVGTATDGHGHRTTFTYDWGVVKDTTTPEFVIARSINADGTVASETRRGLTTSYEYDALGRVRWVKPPLGHWFETQYDTAGRWVEHRRLSAGNGPRTRFDLDGFGRLIGTVDSVGVRTRRAYDVYGRKTYESQPYTGTEYGSTFSYDDLDRVTQISHSWDGLLATYQYGAGLDVSITEYTGTTASRVTAQDWVAVGDPSDGRLVAVTDGEQQTFEYGYDTIGNLVSVSQPGGAPRTWKYVDGTGLVEWEEHPENGRTTYTYDAGRLASKRDATGRTFQYAYDQNDRLTGIDAPGGEHDVQMAYDASDNRTLLANGFVTSTFEFDGGNRLTKRRDQVGATLPAERMDVETKYWYDLWDNLTGITYPSQRFVEYAHDYEGRVQSVKVDGAVAADIQAYHASGAIARLRYGNNIIESFAYDPRDRLQNFSGGPLSLTYAYDRQGNVKVITSQNADLNQTFDYDNVDRLRIVTGFGATEFQYDSLGNRTYKSAGNLSYEYDPASKRLVRVTGNSPGDVGPYTHDAVGNLQTDPSTTYTYTPFNMIETATVALFAGGTRTTAYRYDGDSLRLRSEEPGVGLFKYYVHGAGGTLLSEYSKTSAQSTPGWSRDYIYLGSRLLASLSSTPGTVPSAEVTFLAATSTTTEAAGTHLVIVRLTTSAALTEARSVSVQSSDGTAMAPVDFTAVSGTVTFPVGSVTGAEQTVAVTILRDRLTESAEMFLLTLTGIDGTLVGSPSTHTVTIADVPPNQDDFDGDGRADLVWQHDGTGALAVWHMNGTVQLSGASLDPAAVADTNWKIVGTGDVDRDGDPDLYWQHVTTGDLSVWTMQGLQRISGDAVTPGNAGDVNWRVRTVTDINNDGWPDLIWQHVTQGWVAVWTMNGRQQIEGHLLSPAAVTDTNWRIVGSGTIDTDGFVDLVWQHQTSGDLAWWKLDGYAQVSGAALSPGNVADPNWKIRATVDLNGDGQTDLVWQHIGDGRLSAWLMNGPALQRGDPLTPSSVADLLWRIGGPK